MSEWSQWTYDLWTENVIEAEHDAAALSVSFLVVQSCRFAFSGELADELSPGHEHKQQVIEEFPAFLMVSKCRSFLFPTKFHGFFKTFFPE